MKPTYLIALISILMFSCRKEETILETEKDALYSVFNNVVDSVYQKVTNSKIPSLKKSLVIYDSLVPNSESYFEISRRHKEVKQYYVDTVSQKITPKIDLKTLNKDAKFRYKYKLSLRKQLIEKEFWNSEYALPGVIIFSKVCFDVDKKYGTFFCTYSTGDIYNAKYFLVFVKKVYGNWELEEVYLQHRTY